MPPGFTALSYDFGSTSCLSFLPFVHPATWLREGPKAQQMSPRASCLCSHPSNIILLFHQDNLQRCRGKDTLTLQLATQSPAWTCKILLLLLPLALTPLRHCKTSPCFPGTLRTCLPSIYRVCFRCEHPLSLSPHLHLSSPSPGREGILISGNTPCTHRYVARHLEMTSSPLLLGSVTLNASSGHLLFSPAPLLPSLLLANLHPLFPGTSSHGSSSSCWQSRKWSPPTQDPLFLPSAAPLLQVLVCS